MKTWTLSLALAGSALLAGTARADQCQWNDRAHAQKAQALLAQHPKVLSYCEPCGDKAPGEPFDVESVRVITPPQTSYREVLINGDAVDLAYTYVQVSPTEYKNLAKLAGCPASGVTATLSIAEETPTGVLIATTETPPEQPAPIVLATPTPPPLPPAPQYTYHTTTIVQPIPWLVLALAAGGGFITGAASMLIAMTIRTRRRAMKPRASDLPTS